MQLYRKENGTRSELDQQMRAYASNQELKEKKKRRYQEEKNQQKIWEKQKIERRKIKLAQEFLQDKKEKAWKIDSEYLKWLNDSFSKIFSEYKKFDNDTKEKIISLEESIEKKFIRIKAEIDYKVGKWTDEMERGFDDIRTLYPIFDDFTTGITCHNYGKPLREQNRIELIWHDLKQAIEVKLDGISNEMGKPLEKIPWHGIGCDICKIYRDWKTKVKFSPPRFGHDLDPDTIL